MGEKDPEQRFHSIMDKLFDAPPPSPPKSLSSPSSSCGVQLSRGKKRTNPESALALVEPKTRGDINIIQGSQRSLMGSAEAAPLCRPWDRGDLMRRVATFKSMTWFAKPKVVSAVNCARRGWINVDMDIIACEACGARLLFSTPSSWSQQQVEKAALVFSLKLDNGHKLLCPWIDNACDERLAEFPPTPPQVLVDKFRERSCALLQLLALPVISTSAIEHMRSPQLEEFLRQPPRLEYGNGSAIISQIQFLGSDSQADSANLYYQAQKLISLCGWEPRALPYVVDCKDRPKQLVKDVDVMNPSHMIIDGQNPSVFVHCAANEERMEGTEDFDSCSGQHADPNSVVLDCRLCGATVGLWTFSMISQPLELFKLVGYTDVNGNKNSGQDSSNGKHVDNREIIGNAASDGLLSSIHRRSDFNVTIAGGPPPTKQNFKATISLPIVGRNLRARFSYDSGFRDRTCDNLEVTRSGYIFGEQVSQHKAVSLLTSKTSEQGQCSYAKGHQSSCLNFENREEIGGPRKENSQMLVEGTADTADTEKLTSPGTAGQDSIMDTAMQNMPNTAHPSDASDRLLENVKNVGLLASDLEVLDGSQVGTRSVTEPDAANVPIENGKNCKTSSSEMITSSDNLDGQQIPGEDILGSKNIASEITLGEGETRSDIQNTSAAPEKSQGGTKVGAQIPVNSEVVANSTGKDPKQLALDKAMGFDPIRQHRHFCPWILSTGSGAPGWQQTLSALQRQKEFSLPSTDSPPSSSLIKVDDPIASVRKLFMSPSAKRKKPTSGSS